MGAGTEQAQRQFQQWAGVSAMKTLMVVDDEDDIRKSICSIVRFGSQIKILSAANGKQAIDTYREHRPDYVFLDLGLPDIHGFDVLKSIKEMNPLAKVYIISGYTDLETKNKAKELGTQGFFTKPVNILELLKLVQEIPDAG